MEKKVDVSETNPANTATKGVAWPKDGTSLLKPRRNASKKFMHMSIRKGIQPMMAAVLSPSAHPDFWLIQREMVIRETGQ